VPGVDGARFPAARAAACRAENHMRRSPRKYVYLAAVVLLRHVGTDV
jgi:hypothetical protein